MVNIRACSIHLIAVLERYAASDVLAIYALESHLLDSRVPDRYALNVDECIICPFLLLKSVFKSGTTSIAITIITIAIKCNVYNGKH